MKNVMFHPRVRGAIAAGIAVAALLAIGAAAAEAQITDREWGEGSNGPLTSGNHLWNEPGNWSGNNVPNSTGANGEKAIITDTITGNRTITTPNTATTISLFQWTHQADGVGVNKLVLGNNLTIGGSAFSPITNDGASASNMVIDLAGYKFSRPSATGTTAGYLDNITLINSGGPGGIYEGQGAVAIGFDAVVGANVTLRNTSPNTAVFRGTYHPTSLIILASNNQPRMVEALVGRVQIGEPGGPNIHVELAAAAPHFTAQSDVTIHSTATFTLYPSAPFAVSVGGNFIDYGAADATNYGTGVIAFFNNPATPRTVSIARSLVNDFRVGDNGADYGGLPDSTPSAGHIRLARDLITTGSFTIRGGSSVDLNGSTLTTGNFFLNDGATLGYTIGPDPGVIHVTSLTLDDFTLSLTNLPNNGWQNGDDLILFTYESLNNLMSLSQPTILISDGWIRFDAFVAADNVVMLTNVYVPEPAGAAALGIVGIMLALRRGGYKCRTNA